MELRDIEYFAVVAEHRHLGRAAEALHLTQPALSKSLRRLERTMGAKLVQRTPKGIELTPEGTVLMTRVSQLRLMLTDVAREMGQVRVGLAGKLRVGASPGVIDHCVSHACSALSQEAPDATLTVIAAANDVLLPALRKGELDLIVSGIPVLAFNDLAHEHLFDDEAVLIASADHRLAGKRRVTLADLARERWAVAEVDDQQWTAMRSRLDQTGGLTHRTIVLRTSYLPLRDWMVARSGLVTMSTRRYLKQVSPDLRLIELAVEELAQTRRVGLSYRKDGYMPPLARRFIEILKMSARKLVG